jgi:hypothetical protein
MAKESYFSKAYEKQQCVLENSLPIRRFELFGKSRLFTATVITDSRQHSIRALEKVLRNGACTRLR